MLHRKYYVINMCLPLIIGAFFYLLFRPDILLSRTIYAIFNIRPFYLLYDRIIENAIGRLLVNYLCDFLWAYSLAWSLLYLKSIFGYSMRKTICYCIVTDCIMELLQLIDYMGGTFDYYDIVIQILATLVALIIHRIHIRKEESENEK